MKLRNRHKSFDGWVEFYEHDSRATQSPMRFSLYRPPGSEKHPVLYWLSGLTCTEENFTQKSGIQRYLAKYKIACVAMDTTPRNLNLPNETATWELGAGAGYYVNATQEPWAKHYRMYDYVAHELPELISSEFNIDGSRQGIFGHSMGGHGALMIGLRNPENYRSISAFAPICAASQSPRSQRAFQAYLGADTRTWQEYDTCALLAQVQTRLPILIDQGEDDEFKDAFLQPGLLKAAAFKNDYPIEFRFHPGYDHSYYFVASFIENHIAFHARFLS